VVFSEDIKSALFVLTPVGKGCSNHNMETATSLKEVWTEMDCQVRQRLLLRCLQGLGLVLPGCESTSSFSNNPLLSEWVPMLAAPVGGQLCCSSAAAAAAAAAVNDMFLLEEEEVDGTDDSRGEVGQATTSVAAALYAAASVASERLPSESSSVPQSVVHVISCLSYQAHTSLSGVKLSEEVQRKHVMCRFAGEHSPLCFIIQIVEDVLHNYQDCTTMLTVTFVNQLRCVLIDLLLIRFLLDDATFGKLGKLEVNTIITTDSSSLGSSSYDRTEAVAQLQQQCRAIVESSINSNHNGVSGKKQDHAVIASEGMLPAAPVGDLHLWAKYLYLECMLGHRHDALKVSTFVHAVAFQCLYVCLVSVVLLLPVDCVIVCRQNHEKSGFFKGSLLHGTS
jgi:hypothetical protein